MPRLAVDGPQLVVSADQSLLAVATMGCLRLFEVTSGRELKRAALPAGATDLSFLGSKWLLSFTQLGAKTAALAFALPALTPVARLDLLGTVRPRAVVDPWVLVTEVDGERPRLVMLADRVLGSMPIVPPTAVRFAAATPDRQLLVSTNGQLESWEPASRHTQARRHHLPLQFSPLLAGFTERRILWLAGGEAEGPIDLFRFSDGRQLQRFRLGRPIVSVDGSFASPYLVAATEERAVPTLWLIQVHQGWYHPLPLTAEIEAFALVLRAQPTLAIAHGDAVEWVPIADATPSRTVVADEVQAGTFDSWRNRLTARREPSPAGQPATSPAVAPPPERRAAVVVLGDAALPSTAALEAEGGGWRSDLVAWARAADVQGAEQPLPSAGRLETITARFALDGRSQRALYLLYASWLNGQGGLAPAELAAALAEMPLSENEVGYPVGLAWAEALGRGPLGAERLVRLHKGRLRLRRLVARFVDEAEPSTIRLVGDHAVDRAQPGAFRIDRARLNDAALAALAERSGRLALLGHPAPRRRRLRRALLEAALYEARLVLLHPAVVVLPTLRVPQLIFAVDEASPEALRALPELV